MLNAHPEINIPRTEALYSIYGPYVKVPTGPDPLTDRQWNRLKRLFISDVAIQAWEHPPSLPDFDVDSPNKTFAGAYRLLHRQQARKSGKPIWGAKMLGGENFADRLFQDHPDARFVRCVRDGRAVAASLVENDFGPTSLAEGARHWCASMQAWDEARNRLPEELFFTVKYEDLVLDTERSLRDLLEFLNISWHENCLTYHNTEFAKGRSKEIGHENLAKKPDRTRIDRALSALTRDQIRQIETIAGPYLEKYGYSRVTRKTAESPKEAFQSNQVVSKFKYVMQYLLTRNRSRRASFLQRHRRKIWLTIWPI